MVYVVEKCQANLLFLIRYGSISFVSAKKEVEIKWKNYRRLGLF